MPHWNNAHGRSALTGGGRPLRPPTSDAQVYVLSTDQQPLNRLRLLTPEPSSARPALFKTLFRFDATGPGFDHFVNEAELLSFELGKKFVALDRGGDGFERLAGVPDIYFVEPRPQRQDLARLDFDIRRLPLRTTRGLVDHDARIRQRESLSLRSGAHQQRAHRGGLTDAHRRHRRADVLHRVVDREPRGNHPARR